jgi:hypothetical protein
MISPPTMAPGTLPMPPSTMMTKALVITRLPMAGYTRLIGAYSTAATAASAPEMAKVSIATRVASMPTRAAPSRFCAIAMMVAPSMVLVRNRCSSTISPNAARDDQQALHRRRHAAEFEHLPV